MHSSEQQLAQAQRDSEHLRDIVLLHRPTRVLKQGYSMLMDNKGQQVLTSSSQLYADQTINIMLKDGQATAQILSVKSLEAISPTNDNHNVL
jgi:exodeoxyribonuclease VII large subunit